MTSQKNSLENNVIPESNEGIFRLLFKNHPLPMWIYDIKTLAFLEVNHAAIDKYGYTREEFLALTIKDIRPTEDVPQLITHPSAAGVFRLIIALGRKLVRQGKHHAGRSTVAMPGRSRDLTRG